MFAAYGKNTMANAKFKPKEDDGVVRKVYYPRAPKLVPTIQMIEDAWRRRRAEIRETERLRALLPTPEEIENAKLVAERVRKIPTAPKKIIREVAKKHGLTIEDIIGDSRKQGIIAARHHAMMAVYQNCRIDNREYSLPELGKVFSRDHTTVLSALAKKGIRLNGKGRRPSKREAG